MKAYYSSNVEKVNGYVSIYTLKFHISIFSLLQLSSCVWLFVTPWITAFQASLSITNSQSSLKTHVHRVDNAIQPSHPLSSPSSPAPNPSQHQSFPVSQLFTSGGQNIGVSALASVLPVNTQDWSPLEWTGWISLRVKWKEEESTKNWVMKYSQSREMRNHLSGPDWSEYLVYWILLSYWETGLSVKLIDVIAFELFILVWLWTF